MTLWGQEECLPKAIIIHSDVWSGHRRWRDTSEITDHLSEMDAELLKARNMEILQKFYFIDYDISRDFYEQFHERRKQKTAQKRGLLRLCNILSIIVVSSAVIIPFFVCD